MQIVLVLLIIALIIYLINSQKVKEGFHFRRQYGSWCTDCSNKTLNHCLDCAECGFCIDNNGNGKCVKGDGYGPYNKNNNCKLWYHNNEFSRKLWKNKLRMVKPYIR